MKFLKYDSETKAFICTLYTPISEELTPADEVIRMLQEAEAAGAESFVCRINSPGGNVFEGNTIWRAVRDSKLRTVAIVDGVAASMAAYVLTAFDERIASSSRAKLMLHEPALGTYGNADELTRAADLLRSMTEDFVHDGMKKGWKLKEEELRANLKRDWWLTAPQALELGIISEITNELPINLSPTGELDDVYRQFNMQISAIHKPTTSMKNLAKSLGLPETATEQEIMSAVEAIRAENASIKAAAQADAKARLKTCIDAAIASGKLTESSRAKYEALNPANPDAVIEIINDLNPVLKPTDIIAAARKNEPGAESRLNWTFDRWSKEDPDGLFELKTSDPEAYDQLVDRG